MTIGSLFSGIGGLELGLEQCGLGPVRWQCEIDPFARAVLAKHWPEVRRYTDVREMDETTERVDVITGGFPCQDISNAGKRAGIEGERSGLWGEYARIVGLLRPRFVFVENVSALTARGFDQVLGDLAAQGYSAEWDCLRASDAGAPHRRDRIFVLAYTDGHPLRKFAERDQRQGRNARAAERGDAEPVDTGEHLADANGGGRKIERLSEPRRVEGARGSVADGHGADGQLHDAEGVANAGSLGGLALGGPQERHRQHAGFPPGPQGIDGWDGPQPGIRRGPNGIPGRVDRLRVLGNAVVPAQAALAWRRLRGLADGVR